MSELKVGFDFDLTLAKTDDAIIASLAATAEELKFSIDLDEARKRIGTPIQEELALHLLPHEIGPAVELFRRNQATIGLEKIELLPGALEAVDYVGAIGGTSLIITTMLRPLAAAAVNYLGLAADTVIGEVPGAGKEEVLRATNPWCYVGDHLNDILAARNAGVAAIGVATGNYSVEELQNAGADFMLTTLEGFPALLAATWRPD